MSRLARSLRKRFRKLTNAKTVKIDGVKLVSDEARIPKQLRDLMFREVYEDTERNVLLKILKPGSKVVEIGTGVGFIALLAAKICGADNVQTYEANHTIEKLIRDNFALNGLYPTLHMRAVTVDGRSMSFNATENIISSSAFERGVAGAVINVESDSFANVLNAHNPDVLVMDVEGGEYELLRTDDFRGVKHILVELHPHIIGQDKVDEIKDWLKARSFTVDTSDRKTFHFHRS